MNLAIHPEEHLDERGRHLLFTASHKALSNVQLVCIPAAVTLQLVGLTEASFSLLAVFFLSAGLQRFYLARLRMADEYEDALTLSARTPVSRAKSLASWVLGFAIALAFEIRDWQGWSSIIDALLLAMAVNTGVWLGQRYLRNRTMVDEQ